MKSSKIKMTALALAAAFAFTGCGEALYELTPEEESAVVSYASHVVAKFNRYQRDGEVFVRQEILDGEDEEEQDSPVSPQETAADTEETEQSPQSGEENTEQNGQGAEDSGNMQNAVSIQEALGLGTITAEYGGSSLCATYDQSDSYVVDAEAGKQLLVLKVKLTNETGAAADLDVLQKKPSFDAVVNGEKTVKAQMTILPNDLATYQGSISPGESVDTVIIFQIPEEIQSVSDLELGITIDGSRYTAIL